LVKPLALQVTTCYKEGVARELYVYTRDGERVFKIVSFFLLRAGRGRIGAIDESMRIEVAEARWLPLEEAPRLLAYRGEREMAALVWEKMQA
jgi:hypothetical protein